MTEPITISINIYCPVCRKKGDIKVKKEIIDESNRGITAVHVGENVICSHSFMTYIDNNLDIRDCFAYDFTVELPQMIIESLDSDIIDEKIDVNIIKYHIIPSVLGNIIKGILYKSKIIILQDLNSLFDIFNYFFKYIFKNSFKHDIIFKTRADFKKNKQNYEEYVLFDGNKIINDKEKQFEIKKVKVINSIVQKFFAEREDKTSLIILKNELLKLYTLSQDLIKLNKNIKDNKNFTSKIAIEYLNNKFNTKISYTYLELLVDIIQNYFDVKLKRPPASADILELI